MKPIFLFLAALQLMVIAFKFTGHITASWWIVLVGVEFVIAMNAISFIFTMLSILFTWLAWCTMTPEERAAAKLSKTCKDMAEALKRERYR